MGMGAGMSVLADTPQHRINLEKAFNHEVHEEHEEKQQGTA
jgi:hypothetical protein